MLDPQTPTVWARTHFIQGCCEPAPAPCANTKTGLAPLALALSMALGLALGLPRLAPALEPAPPAAVALGLAFCDADGVVGRPVTLTLAPLPELPLDWLLGLELDPEPVVSLPRAAAVG